jgi:tRNA U34 5-methylaminomethyl-2-thiouridine-forming methyltransferase MnmC
MLGLDELQPFRCDDGSENLRQITSGATYRCTGSAKLESEKVFIEGTRLREKESPWTVLELGFGIAWNFRLTVAAAIDKGVELTYHAFEKEPVPQQLLQGNDIGVLMAQKALKKARLGQKTIQEVHGRITLNLYPYSWTQDTQQNFNAQAVYHDPFAPKINPESWLQDCFRWQLSHSADNVIWASYGAQSLMRRHLHDAGWVVATSRGPGKKREITLAARSPNNLQHAALRKWP